MDDYSKDGDVGWIYSRDARSLGKCLGSPFLQLLAALKSHCWAFVIVKPRWNLCIFVPLGSFRRQFLLTDVPFITDRKSVV